MLVVVTPIQVPPPKGHQLVHLFVGNADIGFKVTGASVTDGPVVGAGDDSESDLARCQHQVPQPLGFRRRLECSTFER